MNMYDFFMPNVNFFGRGAVKVTGERCQILGGKKALIVTDSFLRSLPGGPVEKVTESLDAVGIDYAFYDGVEPNPKDTNVRDGLAIFESEQCDLIVTVGGGSAHDCGKGIGIAATHDGDLYEDYAGIETLTNPLPPLVCVNTTAGTASEVTRHCVITNTEKKVKFVIVSWRNTPLVSINDPELIAGLTAATGMDALTHAVESYVSLGANPVTDSMAIQAIKLISTNLRQAVAYGQRVKTWRTLLFSREWHSTTQTSDTSTRWLTNSVDCTTFHTVWRTLSYCHTSKSTTSFRTHKNSLILLNSWARTSTAFLYEKLRTKRSKRFAHCQKT